MKSAPSRTIALLAAASMFAVVARASDRKIRVLLQLPKHGGGYEDLLPHSIDVEAFGVRFKCVDLPTLIRIKEAAGRAKDAQAVAELRVLLEEQEKNR